MNMELNLIEDFLLLSLDDEKGRFISDTTYLNNGLAGAIMLELDPEQKNRTA